MPLRTPAGKIAFLNVNYTKWKSTSSFKTYGRNWEGQDYCSSHPRGSYGMEAIVCDRMRPEMGPPETDHLKFRAPLGEGLEDRKRTVAAAIINRDDLKGTP